MLEFYPFNKTNVEKIIRGYSSRISCNSVDYFLSKNFLFIKEFAFISDCLIIKYDIWGIYAYSFYFENDFQEEIVLKMMEFLTKNDKPVFFINLEREDFKKVANLSAYKNLFYHCDDEKFSFYINGQPNDVLIFSGINIKPSSINFIDGNFPKAIIGDGIILDEITETDVENYYSLCTDEKLNKFWRYDYEKDFFLPSTYYKESFFVHQKTLLTQGISKSYAIREREGGELLGEVLVCNFTLNKTCEMGCRLLADARGKKLGAKAYKLLADFVENELSHKVKGRCHKENLPSYKMITSSGFTKVSEDETYYYFKRI